MKPKNIKSGNVDKKPFYKKKLFIILIALFVLGLIGNAISPQKSTSYKLTKETHIYDEAKIKNELSGSGEKIGKVSVIKAQSKDITDKVLTDWYFNHVEKTDYNYYLIEYTDFNCKKGVWAINGVVEKDCELSPSSTNDGISEKSGVGIIYTKSGNKLIKD